MVVVQGHPDLVGPQAHTIWGSLTEKTTERFFATSTEHL